MADIPIYEISRAPVAARLTAALIDGVVVAMLASWETLGFWAGLLFLLSRDAYFQGRSPGKRLLGLRTVCRQGEGRSAGIRESTVRNLPLAAAYAASTVPLIGWLVGILLCGVEAVLVAGSPEGTRLGDELAETRVVEDKVNGSE